MDGLEYTYRLFEDFFSRKRIQRSFAMIDEVNVSGWEKWWQIEFALFLSDDDDIAEWDMEVEFHTDLRKEKKKNYIAIDVSFRPKGLAKDKFIFLELKQNKDYVTCLRNMLLDAEKVFNSHSKSLDGVKIRDFFVVGMYPSVEKKKITDCLMEIQKDYDVEVEKTEIKTKFIPNTDYSFTIF